MVVAEEKHFGARTNFVAATWSSERPLGWTDANICTRGCRRRALSWPIPPFSVVVRLSRVFEGDHLTDKTLKEEPCSQLSQ